jgi:hypothetical protein
VGVSPATVSDAMQQYDLLSLVQPARGWFAITGIKGTGKEADVRQELVATRAEADALIERFVDAGRNVFFRRSQVRNR